MSRALDDPGMPIVLRDGSRILVRRLHHADRRLLLDGFERLGPDSRHKRFLAPMPKLSEKAIDHLLDVDHHDHEALAAIDAATGDGIGVARFVRLPGRPDTAEAAVTVIDEWQVRGVGTILLDLLADRAREEGLVRFTSLVLAGNRELLELLESLGPARVVDRQFGTVEIESELPRKGAGRHLHGVLRASARRWQRAGRPAAPPTEPPG